MSEIDGELNVCLPSMDGIFHMQESAKLFVLFTDTYVSIRNQTNPIICIADYFYYYGKV